MKSSIRIGTRGSQLALRQANFIKSEIRRFSPEREVDLQIIKTTGDRITDRSLSTAGGKGLFVKEIETALLKKEIDLAVHSMKDMPVDLPEGLEIGAIPKRENPFDVLISRHNARLADYKKGAVIGTSSLRRASQIKHHRPDIAIKTIRGNLDTRIKMLKSGEYDAIILAAAGLRRLGQEDEITEYLDGSIMIPAVGQGALCIETRQHDDNMIQILDTLNHEDTSVCVKGERAFLKQIEGSCHIPAACFGTFQEDNILFTAMVASEDGQKRIKEKIVSSPGDIEAAGQKLATQVLDKGGKIILAQLNPDDK